jgi:uncharacterized protein (TIGR02099 family)
LNLSVILPLARRGAALLRIVTWILIAAAAFFSLLLLSLRYWVLPNIEQYREDIASAISRASGQHVTVGEINANWDGLRPHMMLGTINVYDKQGNISLLLHRLEGTVSWRSVLHGGLRFREIRIDQPDLIVRRDTAGVIHLAGFALDSDSGENENGFSDWLLRQKRVTINNASIIWQDDLRAAPELELLVDLLLENQDDRHRFGIRAIPPAELAAQLDMRGDFTGRSLDNPEQWQGLLFLRIDRADVSAWQAWLPFPQEIELKRGMGALRMWMGMNGRDIRKLTVDIHLNSVKTQLAKNLPDLNLSRVQGRIGWKRINDGGKEGLQLSASRLSTFTQGQPQLQPLDFSLQIIPGKNEEASSGKLNVDKLNLQTLGELAEYLPMTDALRNFLRRSSPSGEIYHLEAEWDGELPFPSHFGAKGQFTNLGMKKSENLPAFSGMTGTIDITAQGGTLNFNSRHASIELPDMFHEPLLLDTLTGQTSWTAASGNDAGEFRFSNISFSNSNAAGVAYGSYRIDRNGTGIIDLAGHAKRANVPWVMRYLPFATNSPIRTWLEKSMVTGIITDARLHLKGNLDEFPFPDEDQGVFRLSINTSGTTVDLAPQWPRVENISGNIQLHGDRLEFNGSHAAISGANLSKIKLRIRNLAEPHAIVECETEATGETRQFLEIAAKYASTSLTRALSDRISVAGNGKLQIKLDVPLDSAKHSESIKLAGSYQMIGNEIDPGQDLPNLSDINGEVFFTESGISVNNITARLLGGQMSLTSVDTRDGSVRMIALGKINLDNLYEGRQREGAGSPQTGAKYLRGSTEWRGMVHIRNKLANLSIESSLQGITSTLPAPFSKTASERVTLRFERKATSVNQDTLILSYGDIAAAKVKRTQDETEEYRVEEGAVTFGTASVPAAPDMPGVAVSGTIPVLDLDQWRKIIVQAEQAGGTVEAFPNIALVDLRLGNLTIFGRQFTDIELGAKKIDGIWHSTVASSEMRGDISWNPSGNGRIVARLDKLVVPADHSTSSLSSSKPDSAAHARHQQKTPPALDVRVDDLILGNMQLGRLELKGAQHEQNWRIDKLLLSSPDSAITVKGIWHSRGPAPRVQATVTLVSSDIGKLLTRLGHPGRVKRGSGKLEGKVSWDGNPLPINYPSMSGAFSLQAERGQFPKFEPGIGRLFGFFDLRALPRRVMLDFHDVFSEGFGFDDISGDIKIARGVAFTDDLEIEGPAANIILNGEVNLEAETQKLNFRVIPSLGLATPVVGITSMIVNKALQSAPTPNEYNITGTWTNPIIIKTSRQTQEREADEPEQR